MLATECCNLYSGFTVKTTDYRKTQVLKKTRISCLYQSAESGIFYGIFTRAGGQVKKSLKTNDKELARRRLEALRQNVAKLNTKEGRNIVLATFSPDRKALNGGFAKRWLDKFGPSMKSSSVERRVSAIKVLAPHFTNTIRAINKSQVETWASVRMGQVAERTFNIERETLILILDYAISEGLILENPAINIKRLIQPKAQVIIPTKPQFKTLLETLRNADTRYHEAANLVELLAYTGCRLAEATAMKWGDVSFELKNFTVTGGATGTKNKEDRSVPLFPSLNEFLTRLRDSRPTPPQPAGRIVEINDAKNALDTACKKAKLPHFHHHCLRHFFCSNAIEAGIDFKTIAGWLGHKDGGLLAAKTYGHLRDEHSALMAKLMTFSAVSGTPPQNGASSPTTTA